MLYNSFEASRLGSAELVEEVAIGGGRVTKITGTPNQGKTVTVLGKSMRVIAAVQTFECCI